MGAAAVRGLHVGQRGRLDAPVEASATVHDATFLNAVLPYALAQAARHCEPLTVLCLEVDALASLGRAHGPLARDRAVGQVADAVARKLRGSDVVARLDDDRVFALLPNAGVPDALKVAGVVRSAIAAACLPTAGLPPLTVSIGVACYPIDAREMLALLHAADEAMERARAAGANKIATAG
jgi:diguanylate cyclase (GGDEF)-like protein